MKKTTIFQESFLVAGIMCFDSCGNTIQSLLNSCINDCIERKLLPSDAQLIVDAEPSGLGIHRLTLSIESETVDFCPTKNFHATIASKIKEDIVFDIIEEQEELQNTKHSKKNWINILINLIAMGLVITLAFIFPPSILLTASLTMLSFITTAFTSREYLFNFLRNLRTKNLANMSNTISFGWLLSLAHTLFHGITMPLATSLSMVFMSFIMPIMLITCINGMDEIKRLVLEKSKKIQLKGIKTLFPQMSEKYRFYQLSQAQMEILSHKIDVLLKNKNQSSSSLISLVSEGNDNELFIQELLNATETQEQQRNLLREGMLIEVKAGECFPLDCILLQGNTIIDASLLTGESQQSKQRWQSIPAGAINLGQKVTVYATKDAYNSTINSLLFRSNRARNTATSESVPKFAYFYTALIGVAIVAAIFAPVVLGVVTASLIMQNVIGILFSVCPCTIAIAHQLPKLISMHRRSNKGIHLRDENLINGQADEIHTIVFDKTGTLTTGNSVVESSDISINSPLWQRIYLLEKMHGREHPLASAIQKYYEANVGLELIFDEVKEGKIDEKSRGLTARVQGKVIHIGSIEYLESNNIILPERNNSKIEQGFSAVYVAEDNVYKGVIYIKHEVRAGILESLSHLKKQGKKIIMLTGDNFLSARGFNKQINSIFDEEDIHVGQTPKDKETFLKNLMDTPGVNPRGVWFVGDGLNDAPCCRIVSEKGGISCAMDSNNKTVFFTDVCLNGSVEYLFKHNKLNHSLYQNIMQNQGILIYSTIAFLAFIISFSIAGIAVPPLIPMTIMLSTTLFVLFNSYRTQLSVDNALDKVISWPKKLLSSNVSIGLLLGGSALLISAVLVATIATGGLALPVITFTGVAAFSSICTLSAMGLFSAFSLLLSTSFLSAKGHSRTNKLGSHTNYQHSPEAASDRLLTSEETRHEKSLFDRSVKNNSSLRQPIDENTMQDEKSFVF